MIGKRLWRSFFPIFLLALGPLPARSADVFVIDAKGIELAAGQKLDGTKPLLLAVGQRVTLVTSDGRTLKLKGPADSPPAPELVNMGGSVVDSLKGLIKAREVDTSSAGISRGTVAFEQPLPWLVEIGHSGDRCVREGERTVLWRMGIAEQDREIEISPADRSWAATAHWPAGFDKLVLPADLKLNNGQAYIVTLAGEASDLTIHIIPHSVTDDAARAGWMIELGCESQANALVSGMK